MFRYIQRRRIKKVIKLLSVKMVKSYGSRDFFSIGQVETSCRELSNRQQQIAFALFANPQDLDSELAPTVQLLRNDVSYDFFGGENYTARDVLNLLGGSGWKGGRMDDDMSHRMGMNSRY
ncbi:DUF6559 family protein [Vibrio sp. 10N.261.46.E12]|uniref:DUF6559 family protein n=1 Tax=unclassified Vibrio TaxID=2614977 RepID=UPI0009753E38|nr:MULTISPECIES: DUF6559 family protein [unclassified Vibrio]OMO37925.1 hypothetical protein BH584_20265 [Vibrio sp. 10N.261.45.E1]PMJ25021.1 hypothetical protein BCU27_11765 [Vibrio sp. 10N.286.45.B6]PML93813.1 hypothetical protein BCT66_24155 [Vibrio sp. 10N.261.49.E11]PMM68131.1 hypothetical protein BCT48_12635 [Vibrio sp. 10N.261.46.F12]PMM90128.1 hypothetical protein BCT46_23890 [Vibrio sp. 10N.261.46.E8]